MTGILLLAALAPAHADDSSLETVLFTMFSAADDAAVGSPELDPWMAVEATGPSELTVYVGGITPNGIFAIVGGAGAGGEYIPSGPCGGTTTSLYGPLSLVGGRRYQADEQGVWGLTVSDNAAQDVGTLKMQVIDLESCALSEVVAL